MGTPTRWPNGFTNDDKEDLFGHMPVHDRTRVHEFFVDFDRTTDFNTTDWTWTESSATGSWQSAYTTDGGWVKLHTASADNATNFGQLKTETFKFEAGKKLAFKCKMKSSEATQADIVVGLCITDTSLVAGMTDGVYFIKDDGDAYWDFKAEKNNVATSSALAFDTLVANTAVTLGFYYDGKSEFKVYADDIHVATATTTTLPDDEELTVTFGHQAGEAKKKQTYWDYIYVVKER